MKGLVRLVGVSAAPAFFGGLAVGKLAALPPLRRRAAHLGYDVNTYRLIGTAELAGAAGLVVGLRYSRLGDAAGVGLVALLGGACVAHLRAGDGPSKLLPAAAGVLALGAYWTSVRDRAASGGRRAVVRDGVRLGDRGR
ncbi:DoxX family protein [Spongisporangium articulatum]|uniref:DoxX family protein n=1 Tax=Spongisporangium articulatum TaxID=3362603 RepID=A0ABW8ALV8_9ACTN